MPAGKKISISKKKEEAYLNKSRSYAAVLQSVMCTHTTSYTGNNVRSHRVHVQVVKITKMARNTTGTQFNVVPLKALRKALNSLTILQFVTGKSG